MSCPEISQENKGESLSLPLFIFTILVTLSVLGCALRFATPRSIWDAQVLAGKWQYAAGFIAVSLLNCFVEYFFHRYVLHKPALPLLSRFYRQHTRHHSLTRIGRRRTPAGREVPFVENIYPMTEPEQGEASFFPWYSLAVFALLLAPLLALGQWLAPSIPWFFSGYGALAFSLTLYEVFHAIEHWPFEKWAPLLEHARWGWCWRKIYGFHLRHHAVIDCNEAISGFFLLPLADLVFGTCVLPRALYADGAEWRPSEFASPRPCGLIRWCDARADAMVQGRRRRARRPAASPNPAPPPVPAVGRLPIA